MEKINKPLSSEKIYYILLLISFFFCIFAAPFFFFLACSLIVFIIYYIKTKGYLSISFKLHDYFIAFFIFSLLLSTIFSINPYYAWQGFGVFCFYILVYLFFKLMPLDKKKYKKIIYAISVSLIVACGFALIHYFIIRQNIEINLFGQHYYTLEPQTDFTNHPLNSVFQHPWRGGNLIFIVLTFILTFFIIKYNKLNMFENTVLVAAILISLLTLYLTFTRAAVVSVIVVSILSFILTRKYIILYFLVAIAVFFLIFKGDKIISTFEDPLNSPNVPSRLFQYKEGLKIYSKNNILLGIGLLNFQVEFNKKIPRSVYLYRKFFYP